ncbi:MAG: hypothetical protein WB797_00880 [Nocardioides sp.]
MPVRSPDDADLLLPSGAILVHVGPFKTGSSSLQMALHTRRDEVLGLGVHYPGPAYRHLRPIAAVMGRGPRGVPSVPAEEWDELVADIRRVDAPRTVVSSEGLSTAGTKTVARVVHDLGADRVHVVRVERRLDRLLPSAWQERVKSSNETRSYDRFLDDVLSADPTGSQDKTASFWAAHSLERFLGRWQPVLPDDHIHVVVADEGNPRATSGVFERLLGLPEGMLDPMQRPNSSMTWERVELCRRLNEVFDERGWPDRLRRRLLQGAIVNGLREAPPSPFDVRIPPVSGDHLRRTAELSSGRIELLRTGGFDVIGDPEATRVPADGGPGSDAEAAPEVPSSIAIEAVVGAVEELLADGRRTSGKRSKRAQA